MKPRKKWEPEYRFGGDKSSWFKPPLLGQTHRIIVKASKPKRKKK